VTFSTNNNSEKNVLIDPRFAIEWRDIVDFLSEFGPFNGRYVPRYPNSWPNRLKDHLDDISQISLEPVKKQAMLERIRRELPLCSVPISWKYSDDKSWAENASAFASNINKSIVVGDALDPLPFVSWIDAVEDIRQTRKRSWPFQGTVSEYINSCTPLLVNSPSAYLIDCYLDPFSDVAEYLVRSLFAAANGSKCYSIEIITRRSTCGLRDKKLNDSQQMTDSEIDSEFKQIFSHLIPKDRNLKLHLVTEGKLGSDSLRLHDRFFLTLHGSINFGQGFLLVNQRIPQQNAFVADKDHHTRLKQTFIDGVARHSDKLAKISGIAYPLKVTTFIL
jgi:hypothetical protein